MLPIALSVISLFREGCHKNFPAALVLSVAYGSSIGGMVTLVGTPSNAIFAGFMQETYGIKIGFPLWMALTMPVSALLLAFAWVVLTRIVFRAGGEVVGASEFLKAEKLPPFGMGSFGVLIVFAVSIALWIARGFLEARLPWLSDAGIAMAGGLALFFWPSGSPGGGAVLNAETLKKIPLDVLLLIGGGLSLAAAMQSSGLASWIGSLGAEAGHVSPTTLLILVSIVAISLAEFTSNTATTAAFLPVAGALALSLGHSPVALCMAVTLASSCGFMLPVSTPPNAIVYGSGQVTPHPPLHLAWMDRPQTLRTLIGRITFTAIPAFNQISVDSYSRSHLVALNCKVLEITSAFVKTALPTLARSARAIPPQNFKPLVHSALPPWFRGVLALRA
jgi:sodium-dependent dicarboxylate transporter 2/3/5